MRRRLLKQVAAVMAIVFLGSCAHDVHARFPGGGARGTIVVSFTQPMASVTVTVNGQIVADDQRTSRVKVEGVRAGDATVRVVATDSDRGASVDVTEVVQVGAGATATIPIATPPRSTGYYVLVTALVVLSLVLSFGAWQLY